MTYMATSCDRSMCSHIACLFNDVGKFPTVKIKLSYFPSRARLNFRWIFREFSCFIGKETEESVDDSSLDQGPWTSLSCRILLYALFSDQ